MKYLRVLRLCAGLLVFWGGMGVLPVAATESSAPAARPEDSAYRIDLRAPDTNFLSGHLKVGGRNPAGVEINANSRYFTLGGKPWFPVVGEFHYLRYPQAEWERELQKMKAGGINVVACYVFWIYHEEEQGRWNWSGDHDLRKFITFCQQQGLLVMVRLGPWAHGEVRNGGHPDWVLEKCGGKKNTRKDVEPYLTFARAFYEQIAQQLAGLYWKDNGPIIGIQIENELTSNPKHLLTLKKMALGLGMDAPLYTITGWMRVQIPPDEMLPVFAGYPDAFWSRQSNDWARESRVNFFFSHNRDDATIGADLAKAGDRQPNETMRRYPYATVELGGGMQVSYRRRPVIEPDDIAALALTKIGSGSTMQGYYMYHGGANQIGKLSTLNETRATAYPNDLPVINYDFQAPLGQYGQKREVYDALRVQHNFLHDFGSDLAPLPTTLPNQQPVGINDRETLRWAVRSDGRRGYVFINNYQRIEGLPAHDNVQLELATASGVLKLPDAPIRIPAQTYLIWPFNLPVGGATLRYATAQPLCRIGDTLVFFVVNGVPAEFVFAPETLAQSAPARISNPKPGTVFPVQSRDGNSSKILVLSEADAYQAYQVDVEGKARLCLTKAQLTADGSGVRLTSRNPEDLTVSVHPPLDAAANDRAAVFQTFTAAVTTNPIAVAWKQIRPAAPVAPVKLDAQQVPLPPADEDFARAGVWQVNVSSNALKSASRVFLSVDYVGDVGRAYLGERLIDDDFYFGRTWELALNRFAPEVGEKGITLKILPLRRDAPIYIPPDRRPKFNDQGEAIGIRFITAIPEYEATFELKPRHQ